ncbi:MAG: hypothetical protein JWM74_1802 [Myxococcaceae bacterium]|nr:hypothetical protein [Myxococcaceae bacterium]
MSEGDAVDLGLAVLGAVIKNAPAIADWFSDVTHGRQDAISLRVKDLLPEESKSAAALRALGGA